MTHVVVTSVITSGNELGEGVTWCSRTQRLLWTDIQATMLWAWTPATDATQTWHLPERLACFALCENPDWLLAGFASQLAFLHLPSGSCRPIVAVEADLPTRVNDGACDREGRFVFGTLHEPVDGGVQQPVGSFYRLDHDLSLHRLDLGHVAIANALAFSPDGRTLYFCDTPMRRIQCADYALDGSVSNVRTFVDPDVPDGVPDGACVDAQGGLWNAQWGASRVVRYAPDGRADVVIELPVRQPTRPTFGGARLDTLYVTSAWEGLAGTSATAPAGAGDVLAVKGDWRGLPEACFGGRPQHGWLP
ncbi:MAG TPA: SMP-30/gluconolactonase/LRE family protein [Rhodanobacteraceae bacterium]